MSIAYIIRLEGAQEVPGVVTSAGGRGTLVFDDVAVTLSYRIGIGGIDFGSVLGQGQQTPATADDVTGVHIHNGARGVNGSVAFNILTQDADDFQAVQTANGGTRLTGLWENTDPSSPQISAFATALGSTTLGNDANFYVNIHTNANAGGEIRGQLVAISDDTDNTIEGSPGNDFLPGLGGNDTINGNNGNDLLAGGPGSDTLNGGTGRDGAVYTNATVGAVADLANAASNSGSAAGDTYSSIEDLHGSEQMDTLRGDGMNNRLFGNGGVDTLEGRDGEDTLDGGEGADMMFGGTGNDTYVVDNVGDMAIEASINDGFDIVQTSVTLDMFDFIEQWDMTGTGDIETNGNDLANFINGNDGNNYINGAAGTDVMTGGMGNDTYTVDNLNDVIVEQMGGGDDAVYSENDVQLPGNIETAILSPTFMTAVSAFGDASDNQLFGNEFDNVLYGRGGLDRMGGGGGDDIFVMAMGDQAANVQEQITDFEGAGVAGGDRMGLGGFGAGATVVQVGTSSYEVRDAGNVAQASFILEGVTTALTMDDYYFT